MIKGLGHIDYEERLKQLSLQTLEQRRNYLDLVQTYRLHKRIDSVDHPLLTMVNTVHERSTRQAENLNLIADKSQLDLRKNFYSQRIVQPWNKLPLEVKNSTSLAQFKTNLSQYLLN